MQLYLRNGTIGIREECYLEKEGKTIKLSARNQLKGTVKSVTPGAVNAEVVITLAGGTEVVSIITKASAESLALAPGKAVYAVVKASSVMVAVD